MTKLLHSELDRVKARINSLGVLVEKRVHLALSSVFDGDVKRSEEVIGGDRDIDLMEVELEEECLKLLALHQPVAIDLRYIIAILKMNNDLERIGDLAVNIAQRGERLARYQAKLEFPVLGEMADKVKWMLRESLASLLNTDTEQARRVLAYDNEVDQINKSMYGTARALIEKNVSDTERMLLLLSVSKNLERIADHATNIAEDVVYLTEGHIVRHRLG